MATKKKMAQQVQPKHIDEAELYKMIQPPGAAHPTISPGALQAITSLAMVPGVGEILGGLLGGASAAGVPGADAAIGSKALVPALAAGGAVAASKVAGGKKKAAAQPSQTPATPAQSNPTSTLGPAIMPLFMQQIMQPYLNSIMQQIHQTGQQYGNYMQGMVSGKGPTGVALHPAIAQALQAMIPGQQASMDLLGQSGAGSVVAGGALDQLSQQIQKGTQAQQAAQGAYEKQLIAGQYNLNPLTGAAGLQPTATGIPGLTNPATNPLTKQIATGGGTITG